MKKKGLLRKYQGSISSVLKAVYPYENWNESLCFEIKLASSEAVRFSELKLNKNSIFKD